MTTKTLYMAKGLPASGKTTWTRQLIHTNKAGEVVRINKDDMRAMFHDSKFDRDRTEKFVLAVRDRLVTMALEDKFVRIVVVDDTNLAPKHEVRLRQLAEESKAGFVVQDFTDVPIKECIARDLKRPNSVGHKVINRMNMQFIAPKYDPPLYDETLDDAIVADIDGTLAHVNGRSHYDYSSAVLTDVVDPTVADVVNTYGEHMRVILVSGRKDQCRNDTVQWLVDNKIRWDHLHMRASDDDRPDNEVKGEIYDKHIAGHFNIHFVLDDRDQVVAMWRQRGLKVLQCADGDF